MNNERREIKRMPDKETLEAFLEGLSGDVKVVFNIEKGRFDWVVERPDHFEDFMGDAKTELGEWLKRL